MVVDKDKIDTAEIIPGTDFSDFPEIFEKGIICKKDLNVDGKVVVDKDIHVKESIVVDKDIHVKESIVVDKDIHVKESIYVTKDIFINSADCAEEFDVGTKLIEAGSVVVLKNDGMVVPCSIEYDKKVAGVISGASRYKPGIILDRKKSTNNNRLPVALMGKVYCKVDADYAPIECGDLLTTSNTEGHAMKSIDPTKAFGSVIGKALSQLKNGKGLIPILVNLQ